MRIAVVGGNGFIGTEFIDYSEKKGHESVIVERDIDAFSDEGVVVIKSILKDCDSMVFLAAKRLTNSFSIDDYIFNVNLAYRYFGLASEVGLNNIVITSSIGTYSSSNLPWREDYFEAPFSLYGASKQAVDSLALWYNEKKGMRIKSLRLAQVIGMGERKGYLLNTLIDNAIAGRKQIIFGKGIGKRQYIYIKDVCDAILHSISNEGNNGGIYNIGMDTNVSIINLAKIINQVFENKAGIEILEDEPEDIKEYLMDISKTERELHWKPHFNLDEAFMDIRNS